MKRKFEQIVLKKIKFLEYLTFYWILLSLSVDIWLSLVGAKWQSAIVTFAALISLNLFFKLHDERVLVEKMCDEKKIQKR